MRTGWRRWWQRLAASRRWRGAGPASGARPATPGLHDGAAGGAEEPDGDFDWVAAVDQARKDWEQARRYFECVTDRDLVDQAIHLVTAAEKRYAYLLKQARRRGVQGLPAEPGEAPGRRVAT